MPQIFLLTLQQLQIRQHRMVKPYILIKVAKSMCFKIVGHSWQPERGLEIRGFIYTMEHLILCRTRELLEPLMAMGSGYKGQLPQLGQFKIVHLYMDY